MQNYKKFEIETLIALITIKYISNKIFTNVCHLLQIQTFFMENTFAVVIHSKEVNGYVLLLRTVLAYKRSSLDLDSKVSTCAVM